MNTLTVLNALLPAMFFYSDKKQEDSGNSSKKSSRVKQMEKSGESDSGYGPDKQEETEQCSVSWSSS